MQVYKEKVDTSAEAKPEGVLRLVEDSGWVTLQVVDPDSGIRLCNLMRFSDSGAELHGHADCINYTGFALPEGLKLDSAGRLVIKRLVLGGI